MDFDFSEEQYLFRDTLRKLLGGVGDLAKARSLLEGDGVDGKLWSELTALGAFGVLVPEEHSGLGLTFVDLALMAEEFGRALVPSPVAETIAATDVIVRHATPEQKARLLPKIAAGELKLVPATLEPDAGFDPGDIRTAALPSGNAWRLSGRKMLVPHAATADVMLVAARFGGEGQLGIALLEPGREGVSLRSQPSLDPCGRYCEVTFDAVPIIREDILGGGPSPVALARLLDANGALAATQMTGIASKVLDDAVSYASHRTQFGRPIGSFQAIKHRCADMAVAVDASRSAAYYASWTMAEDSSDRAKAVSMAKSFCGDSSRFVCNEGIQIHGGIGFTWDLGLHFYLRRAKVLEYSYGDAAYHRERVLAETLAERRSGG
ncbi:Acyl-CoA dehydrogenase [Rhizobiales bacterium GAS113]|nr:Acyl-CoA dehydrogenase [Rhizobiales bacterium GAS113]